MKLLNPGPTSHSDDAVKGMLITLFGPTIPEFADTVSVSE
jgi:hypothetical protein